MFCSGLTVYVIFSLGHNSLQLSGMEGINPGMISTSTGAKKKILKKKNLIYQYLQAGETSCFSYWVHLIGKHR